MRFNSSNYSHVCLYAVLSSSYFFLRNICKEEIIWNSSISYWYIRLSRKFVQLTRKKIWDQHFPYWLNASTWTNNHTNPFITSTFYTSRNQDSPNSDSQSLSFHYPSQNSCHQEKLSDLRIDDNRWVQDLQNMQDDSIRWNLCDAGLVNRCVIMKKQHTIPQFLPRFSRIEERNRWRSDT